MERVTDHVNCTRWRGEVAGMTASGYARQALCGDEVWIYLIVDCGIIRVIRFGGKGCALSMACASMLCEAVEGGQVEHVLAESAEGILEVSLQQLSMYKQRCATLCWQALRAALLSDAVAITAVSAKPVANPSENKFLARSSATAASPHSSGIPP